MNPPTKPTLTATVPPNASEKGRSKRPGSLRRHLRHGIGQIIRTGGSAALPPDALAEAINQIQRFFIEETWLGIPAILHKECCARRDGAPECHLPQPIGLASAFQPDLIAEMTEGHSLPTARGRPASRPGAGARPV
nr:glycoside hydrolase family 3 N-terminal domain-containing protein [Candidatus Roseilinea sp. NK_OTU-006]